MAPPRVTTIILLLSALLVINAELTCSTDDEMSTICGPGDEDFILNKEFVSNLPRPSSITLRGCRVTDILPGSFNNDSSFNLKHLDLSINKLTDLNENVFAELNNLVHLNLSYNLISKLPDMIFSKVTNLETLDLRGNNIKQLELGLFVHVRLLRYLDLAYNALKGDTLHPLVLQVNADLQYLDLSGNNLDGLISNFFSWARALEVLHLNGCLLSEVPNLRMFNLKTIKHLSLSYNTIRRIEKVNTFHYLKGLEILNLGYNEIEYIVEKVFFITDQLNTIVLKNNKLKEIPEELFQDMPNLTNLDLSYNFIKKLEADTFRSSQLCKLSNLNFAGNRFAYLPKHFCADLRNIQVILKQLYFHQNPWQCSCLNEIITEVKKFRIEYDSDRFNGKVPVCVIGNQIKCDRSDDDDEKDDDSDDDDEDDNDSDDDNNDSDDSNSKDDDDDDTNDEN